MTRRIILHIGSPKCGSTYLQRVLLQNRSTLEKHAIRYPHDGGNHPGNAGNLGGITSQELEQFFHGGIETVVLSHEDLYSLAGKHGNGLAELCREASIEVQVVAFLRPFNEFIFGDYSQFMKQFFDVFLSKREAYNGKDFKAFAQRRVDTMDPAAYLRQWQRKFPNLPLILAGNREIRSVMSSLIGGSVTEALNWTIDASHVNLSLRMSDCDAIAGAMTDASISNAKIKAMFLRAFHETGQPDAGKTEERIAWVEEKFAQHNQKLLEEFNFDNRRKPS
ncbi:hypothetical protein [Tateyamaria sp.]|uniref:hypothetical protein n=1 Tax=Tateyamaria sp. TaxID=1929288 RepID=UPI0032A1003D